MMGFAESDIVSFLDTVISHIRVFEDVENEK
jgi:hypothetical protein